MSNKEKKFRKIKKTKKVLRKFQYQNLPKFLRKSSTRSITNFLIKKSVYKAQKLLLHYSRKTRTCRVKCIWSTFIITQSCRYKLCPSVTYQEPHQKKFGICLILDCHQVSHLQEKRGRGYSDYSDYHSKIDKDKESASKGITDDIYALSTETFNKVYTVPPT